MGILVLLGILATFGVPGLLILYVISEIIDYHEDREDYREFSSFERDTAFIKYDQHVDIYGDLHYNKVDIDARQIKF